MTEGTVSAPITTWTRWRVLRWVMASGLLLTPLVMMQFSPDWNWSITDFLFAGIVILGVSLLYEMAERASGNRAYRIGAAIALGTCFLLVWSTLVRDDGNGVGFFLVVMAAAIGAFAGRFSPAALMRTMLGIGIMQALLGLAVATAPVVADVPGASSFYLSYTGFFCFLWLTSAGFFRVAK